MGEEINALRGFLSDLPSTTVKDTTELSRLLARCWCEFSGCNDGGMVADKLVGRIESVEWNPPHLKFIIERHGGTVHGSARAELQYWQIDIDRRAACIQRTSHRQLSKMAPRLDVHPLCEEVCHLIVSRQSDPRLLWKSDSQVQVRIGQIIQDVGPVQTTQGRRRRFRDTLSSMLASHGWLSGSRANMYQKDVGETHDDAVHRIHR